MNLFEMAARRDAVLSLGEGVIMTKRPRADGVWRTFWIPDAAEPQVVIADVLRWHPFWSRPETVGWFVRSLGGSGTIRVRLTNGVAVVAESSQALGVEPAPLLLPWPSGLEAAPPGLRLELHAETDKAGADLMINRVMDRAHLLALAHGEGLEIGPGPKPQIRSSADVSVRYLEEMPQEKWAANYDGAGRRGAAEADWSQYVIGAAHEPPVEDGSLDFVFMSHVFEHLANPIGHLERWSAKLRPGGAVLVVCPDIAGGSKDYAMRPSTLAEWRAEHAADIWKPEVSHFERFAAGRGQSADQLRLDSFSIHVHFYERQNTAALLADVVGKDLFCGFNITYNDNNKDFYFICIK